MITGVQPEIWEGIYAECECGEVVEYSEYELDFGVNVMNTCPKCGRELIYGSY